jgi:hypothetical protein
VNLRQAEDVVWLGVDGAEPVLAPKGFGVAETPWRAVLIATHAAVGR